MPTQLAILAVDTAVLSVNPDKDYIARIPDGLDSEDRLFDALAAALQFPSYFGANWNALSDCLRDLSWIPNRRVVILHGGIPPLDNEGRAMYLDVLATCVGSWKADEDHELIVVFRSGVDDAVRVVVEDRSPK